jgi:hypothetical protein
LQPYHPAISCQGSLFKVVVSTGGKCPATEFQNPLPVVLMDVIRPEISFGKPPFDRVVRYLLSLPASCLL